MVIAARMRLTNEKFDNNFYIKQTECEKSR